MNKTEAILNIDIMIQEIKNQMRYVGRGSGKTMVALKHIRRGFEQLEALEMAKQALEKSSEGCPESCTDDVFDKMKYRCEYGHLSYDENRVGSWTCHHVNNKPKGCSWGTCDKSLCPILK